MIWFWSRDRERMRLETRYDNESLEFVLTVHDANGGQAHERFSDIDKFGERVAALERKLEEQLWSQDAAPLFVPEGFPKRPLRPDAREDNPTHQQYSVTKPYAVGGRTFTVTMLEMRGAARSSWRVESVVENVAAEERVAIPITGTVLESTEAMAFARVCNRIDQWLLSNR